MHLSSHSVPAGLSRHFLTRLLLGLAVLGSLVLNLLLPAPAHAEDEVAIPPLTARVTDLTGTLSPQDQAALENRLAQLEQQKGSQIAILLVPTTQPETVEQYALRVAEAWKLGRGKVDDGVLILLAKNDRKMRIEVGYGLEGAIPDVIAKRIIAEVMAPAFRQGNFAGGLAAAADTLARLIDGEQLPAPPARQSKSQAGGFGEMLPLLLFGGLILGGVLKSIFGNFLGGSLNGGLVGLAVFLLGGGLLFALVLGVMAFIITMSGGFGLPMMGGGGFGGGSGGGGFSGGGGSFGGGGASGDW